MAEHFESLNSNDSIDEADLSDVSAQPAQQNDTFNAPFTEDEVKKLITDLRNGKACGLDHLRNEFLKSLPDDNISVITRLFNVVLMTGLVPEAWCIGAIVPLYKGKGPKDDLDNYRGITLLSCLGKLFTSLINTLDSFFRQHGGNWCRTSRF